MQVSRTSAIPALGFDLYVVSENPRLVQLAADASPRAMRVVRVGDAHEASCAKRSPTICCGLVVDFELGAAALRAIVRPVQRRWFDLPALIVGASTGDAIVSPVRNVRGRCAFEADGGGGVSAQIRSFARAALDEHVQSTAWKVGWGLEAGLSPGALESFALWMMQALDPEVASPELGVSSSEAKRRVDEMTAAWEEPDLEGVALLFSRLVRRPVPAPELVRAFERAAERRLLEARVESGSERS